MTGRELMQALMLNNLLDLTIATDDVDELRFDLSESRNPADDNDAVFVDVVLDLNTGKTRLDTY